MLTSTYMSSLMPTHWLTLEWVIPSLSLPPNSRVNSPLWHGQNSNSSQLHERFSVALLRNLYVSFLAALLLWGSFHYFNRTALSSQSITQPIITANQLSVCTDKIKSESTKATSGLLENNKQSATKAVLNSQKLLGIAVNVEFPVIHYDTLTAKLV